MHKTWCESVKKTSREAFNPNQPSGRDMFSLLVPKGQGLSPLPARRNSVLCHHRACEKGVCPLRETDLVCLFRVRGAPWGTSSGANPAISVAGICGAHIGKTGIRGRNPHQEGVSRAF